MGVGNEPEGLLIRCAAECEQPRVRRRVGSVKGGHAVHVLRRVLDVPQPQVGILDVVERERLEATPADAEDERVATLQDLEEPRGSIGVNRG